jgi:hypothetical protein
MWGAHPCEHRLALTSWAASSQPADDRLTDVTGERQPVLTVCLASDHHVALAPVDVAKVQACHLAGTQPEAGQDHQDGEVPPPDRCAAVTALEKADHV